MDIKTNLFIQKATAIHGTTYNYTKIIYVATKQKVEVICKHHGSFFVTPNNHLTRKSGCPACACLLYGQSKRLKAKETFVVDSIRKHDNVYDYSQVDYTTSHRYVTIICKRHGPFKMMPYCHRQGQGCPLCGKISMAKKLSLSHQQFVDRANLVHKFKYDYTMDRYVSAKQKVQIICNKHGSFFQRPSSHLHGEGCPECGKLTWWAEQGGYSESYFQRNNSEKDTPAILYVVCFQSKTEKFYKVGITKQTLKQRYHWGYSEYTMKIICQRELSLYEAYSAEQKILEQYKKQKYCPSIKIGGWTECLRKDINVDKLVADIQSHAL